MKFYVAAKFEDRLDVRFLYGLLQAQGHQVTHDWTGHVLPQDHTDPCEMRRQWAAEDIEGVRKADVLIAYLEKPHAYRGAFIEIGAAVALGKPVWVIGKIQGEATMMHHPLIEFISWRELQERTVQGTEVKK